MKTFLQEKRKFHYFGNTTPWNRIWNWIDKYSQFVACNHIPKVCQQTLD